MGAAEIYRELTTGSGAGSLGDTQHAASQLSDQLLGLATRVGTLAAYQSEAWQGEVANEASANSCTPLIETSAEDSARLGAVQAIAHEQMSAFQNAKNSVKPVAAQEPGFTDEEVVALLHGDGQKYTDRVTQWQADSQHNVQVFSGYSATSGSNNGRVPAKYAELRDAGAQITLASAEDPAKPGQPRSGGRGGGLHRPPSSGPRPVERGPDPSPTPSPAPGPPPTPEPGPVRHPGDQPPVRQPPGWQVPPERADERVEKQSWPPVPPRFQPVPSPSPISLGQGDGTGGHGSAFGPLGCSPGGTGSGPVNLRGGAGADSEPGGRSGARVPGESASARGGAAGAAGSAGKNAASMAGPLGGKGGKGEADKEKKAAPYLREADPDEVFGGNEVKPVPPVIGDRPQR
ncbi:hypothetical protein G3I59_11215 [Amycolatopsis rubida]|nr:MULTISPECIES: hypothetical protein [Amycolatopsis]MYW91159.1 hypothetical protein [Amycolatopsis rubida]NEC56144.1 hypothetical protein [Amycolatopsis rubida]